MSKSILIIDTPTSCVNCPCIDGEYGECQLTNKSVPLYVTLDCCPLKPYKDAIPIEWIKKKIKEKKERFVGYCDELTPVFVMYEQVLSDWEKENE